MRETIVGNNGLQVTCNAKLMENVKAAKPVSISMIGCCTIGLTENLSGFITPEGLLKKGSATIIVADDKNESGSKAFPIPISGEKMAAFLDRDNCIVVLAAGNNDIQVAKSKTPFTMGKELDFEKLQTVFNGDSSISDITDMVLRRVELNNHGSYQERILVACRKDNKPTAYLADYDQGCQYFTTLRKLTAFEQKIKGDGEWEMNMGFLNGEGMCFPPNYIYYDNTDNMDYISPDDSDSYKLGRGLKEIDLDFAHVRQLKSSGYFDYNKIQSEHMLYVAKRNKADYHHIFLQDIYHSTLTPIEISCGAGKIDINSIEAVSSDSSDFSCIFAIGDDLDDTDRKDDVLYFGILPNDISKIEDNKQYLMPIYSGVNKVFPCKFLDGTLSGYLLLTIGSLIRFVYVAKEDSLMTFPVEIDDTETEKQDKINTFNCYHIQLDFGTSDGLMIPAGDITITSPYTCLLEIMGKRYVICNDKSLKLKNIISPTLYITQYADEIYSSEFGVNISTKDAKGNELTLSFQVNPSAQYENVVGNMTAKDWCNAKKSNDDFLIPKDYNSEKNMESMRSAISKISKATKCSTISLQKGVHARRINTEDIQEFSLEFDGYDIIYSENNVYQLYLSVKAECLDGSQLKGIFGKAKKKLAGLIKAASKKLVEITKVIVVKTRDVVNTVVEFVKDGIKYVVEEILDFVSKAYDTITAIFARISVLFQDIMEWIGYLFNWDDIKKNAEEVKKNILDAIGNWKGILYDCTNFTKEKIDKIPPIINGEIDKMENKWGNIKLCDLITGFNNTQHQKQSIMIGTAASNNIFLENLLYFPNNMPTNLQDKSEKKVSDAFIQLLNDIENLIKENCDKAIEPITTFINSIDKNNFFDTPLKVFFELIRGLASIPFCIVNSLFTIVEDTIDLIFEEIQSFLEENMNIPFFSYIFKKLSGGMDCNLINIVSLVLSLPYTAIKKIIKKEKTGVKTDSASDYISEGLALLGAILTPIQKIVDFVYSIANTGIPDMEGNTVKPSKYLNILNTALAFICDTLTTFSWLTMIILSIDDSTLNTLSRLSFAILGYLLVLSDMASVYLDGDKQVFNFARLSTLFAITGGILTCVSSLLAFIFYFAENSFKDILKKNAFWDCASMVSSGFGSISTILFEKAVNEVTEYVAGVAGVLCKIVFSFLSGGTCIFSCVLTFNPLTTDKALESIQYLKISNLEINSIK